MITLPVPEILTTVTTVVTIGASIVIAALILIVTIVIIQRIRRPHSKKMDQEQEQVDRKTKSSVLTSASPLEKGGNAKILELIKRKISFSWIVFGNIATALIGIAVFLYFRLEPDSGIRPADIGSRTWDYWRQILAAWSVIYFLIWLNAEKTIAPQLQKIPFWIVVTLLVLLPSWSWITSTSQSSGAKGSVQKTGCVMPFTERSFTDHPAFGPDGGYSARDKWLPLRVRSGENSCLVENPRGGHIEWDSDNPSIHDLEVSCVYERGGTGSVRIDGCKGGVVTAGYVDNPTDAPVTVWYAYAKN